jgi:hypothetical protein
MKAKQLDCSGVCLVSEVFGVDPKTVRKGKEELETLPESPSKPVHKAGGGAKKTNE